MKAVRLSEQPAFQGQGITDSSAQQNSGIRTPHIPLTLKVTHEAGESSEYAWREILESASFAPLIQYLCTGRCVCLLIWSGQWQGI